MCFLKQLLTVVNLFLHQIITLHNEGHHGHDHMVVGFTTTYAISAYHHYGYEFE
jgi:hypothetical protein